jgi:hypothetical protein
LPLRRPLAIIVAAVCLLAVRTGVGRTQTTVRRPLPPPPLPSPAAVAATLLRNAQPFLRSARSLDAAASAFPDEGALQLYHLRYEQVMANGLSGLVEQRVFQIRGAGAARLFALDNVWYDKARNRFRLVAARVWRRDHRAPGGWRLAGAGRDLGDLHPGGTGNQPRRIALPRLRAGDRISVLYELLPDDRYDWSMLGGRFLGNLFAFRDTFATVAARYVLAAPRRLATAQVGVGAPRVRRLAGGWQWSWSASHLPAFFSSPDGPSITDRSPFVQVSGFSSWAAMATWYNNLLAQRARLTPAEAKRLLAIAGPSVPDPTPAQTRAVIRRVWSYLSGHLAYRGNESGIHAYVPAPVGDVLARQAGDCKDGALLLATWLRAAGVEADLALVRTPDLGRLTPTAASGAAPATMAAFDHALVYIPRTRQWIDTTAPNLLASELPSSDRDSLALIVRSGQRRLVRVPVAPAAANLTRRRIRLTPAGADWMQASGEVEITGAAAPAARERFADAGRQSKAVAGWLRDDFPGAEVGAVTVSGVQPPADTVRIRFQARIPLQPLRAAWQRSRYLLALAAARERRQRLELPYRWRTETVWSMPLRPHQACARRPVYRQSAPFGSLVIASGCSHGWYQVRYQVTQAARVIEPGGYPAFRAFWQAVDQRLNAPPLWPGESPLPLSAGAVAAR